MKTAIGSFLKDKRLIDEVLSKSQMGEGLPQAKQWNVEAKTIDAVLSGKDPEKVLATRPLTEAIILLFGRPALLIRNDTFEVPKSDQWKERLYPTKSNVERSIKSVGRVELLDHPSFTWVGTGWMVAEGVILTNRHVAMEFAYKKGKAFSFTNNPEGKPIRPRIDFKEEYKQGLTAEYSVAKVVFIEDVGDANPDLALMQLDKNPALPPPIELSQTKPDGYVAVVGYPARDYRNDTTAMVKVFGDIYNVKRLSPGEITSFPPDGFTFTHDCSTLGGNSGSAVIDVKTGKAVGLHFGGLFQQANYAVKAATILKKIQGLKLVVAVGKPPETLIPEGTVATEARTVDDYDGRGGYEEAFLGAKYKVALPTLDAENAKKAAAVKGSPKRPKVLDYTHFSIMMNKARRMAFFTASNIDGNSLKKIPRKGDKWYIDPRVAVTFQAGNDIYANNDLDRGHLVRRLDPVWGDDAKVANDDTFHFTNACPQHKDFNQKTWNELEDYILDNAGVHDLKVSVFTGPIFEDDDQEYRDIQLPRQFWKVVVMVRDDTKKMSATAYIMSQANLLTDIEFAFGQFKTYQVPIKFIENMAGIKFGDLSKYDPKKGQDTEAVASFTVVRGPEDIQV